MGARARDTLPYTQTISLWYSYRICRNSSTLLWRAARVSGVKPSKLISSRPSRPSGVVITQPVHHGPPAVHDGHVHGRVTEGVHPAPPR